MSRVAPLRLELCPSRRLAAAIVGAHAAAAACLAAVLPPAAGAAVAVLLVGLGVAAARDRALHAGPRALRALELPAGDQLTIELASGERLHSPVGPRRAVNRVIVSLPVRVPMRRTILVTADMLEAPQFRALRLWAIWGRTPGAAAGAQAA